MDPRIQAAVQLRGDAAFRLIAALGEYLWACDRLAGTSRMHEPSPLRSAAAARLDPCLRVLPGGHREWNMAELRELAAALGLRPAPERDGAPATW
jgi:hypothetical protein